jgi:hypothetical protein
MVGLTIAIILFLITLTAVIVILIIASGREVRREDQFNLTLTNVWSSVAATKTALIVTPTAAPTVIAGQFPFEPAPGGPAYSAAPACDQPVISGQVLDGEGQPTDALSIQVWGDYLPLQIIPTGNADQQEPGHWSLNLSGAANRRIWVQLATGERLYSAPVEVVFEQSACDRSRVEIVFQQVAAWE